MKVGLRAAAKPLRTLQPRKRIFEKDNTAGNSRSAAAKPLCAPTRESESPIRACGHTPAAVEEHMLRNEFFLLLPPNTPSHVLSFWNVCLSNCKNHSAVTT